MQEDALVYVAVRVCVYMCMLVYVCVCVCKCVYVCACVYTGLFSSQSPLELLCAVSLGQIERPSILSFFPRVTEELTMGC